MRTPSRRLLLAGAGASLLPLGPGFAAGPVATPQQTEGPFYPTAFPADMDNDLVRVQGQKAQAQGQITHVAGRVLNRRGEPVKGAMVEIWQCDAHGIYNHPRQPGLQRRDTAFQGYGRSEALVQARHPDRFSMVGSARWRGRIYAAVPRPAWRERIYRGLYGAAPYQSVYRGGGELRDTAHQLGVPLAIFGLLLTPLVLVARPLLAVPILSALLLAGLAISDFSRTPVPLNARTSAFRFRLGVTFLNLVQPVARAWGRARNRSVARRSAIAVQSIEGPIQQLAHGTYLMPEKRPRPEIAENVVQLLRRAGMQVVPPTGWESYDALLFGSALVGARLVTSAHPPGWVQLRIERYLRWKTALLITAAIAISAMSDPRLAVALAVAGLANVVWGVWRTGMGLHRVLRRGSV